MLLRNWKPASGRCHAVRNGLRECQVLSVLPKRFPTSSYHAMAHSEVFHLDADYRRRRVGRRVLDVQISQLCFIWTSVRCDYGTEPLKPSSKVEKIVASLKEKAEEKVKAREAEEKQVEGIQEVTPPKQVGETKTKKSLKQRIADELMHYYHGFRLLVIDINVSRKLLRKVLQGKDLTRREHKLLIRTVGDVFRMVPFSVFIIVPFMEFTLPVFLKFFPGMLPSTFQTSTDKENKLRQTLKLQLEMAKFLQKALSEIAVDGVGRSSKSAKEFAQFFEKVRVSGKLATSEEILKFSKLFEDEITLDSLPRPQLMALCRVLEMNPIGTTQFLRFQLRLKLRFLSADDLMILKEGVDSLTQAELQQACRARGMRALGVTEQRLKAQMKQWLDLSLVKRVPPSLLLLSQAFMFPETICATEKLAATISALPDSIGTHTQAVIGESEGKVDNKAKIEVVKEEIVRIKLEEKEMQEAETFKTKTAGEIVMDPAPVLVDQAKVLEPSLRVVMQDIKKVSITKRLADDSLATRDLGALERALDELSKSKKKLVVEMEELHELRREMTEYQEDISNLQKVMPLAGNDMEVRESRAAQLLFRRVAKMISKMDNLLTNLKPSTAKAVAQDTEKKKALFVKPGDKFIRIDDVIATIHKLHASDKSQLVRISEILGKIDGDKDGVVRVESVLKVLELVRKEKVIVNKKHIDELIDLVDKEEALELDEQILQALKKKEVEGRAKVGEETPAKVGEETPVKVAEPQQPPPPSIEIDIENEELGTEEVHLQPSVEHKPPRGRKLSPTERDNMNLITDQKTTPMSPLSTPRLPPLETATKKPSVSVTSSAPK